MKTDIPLHQLRYFLQDNLYLLKADYNAYQNPSLHQPAALPQLPALSIETPAPVFKYIGDNQKNFLIICHYTDATNMPDAHLTALLNTLTRINFTQDDIAIINLSPYINADWEQLNLYFKPAKLLILGSEALPVGLPKPGQNQVQQIDEVQVLYTFSFEEMIGNKENTKAFWNQIKTF